MVVLRLVIGEGHCWAVGAGDLYLAVFLKEVLEKELPDHVGLLNEFFHFSIYLNGED
jgi:hypothetical protein